MYGASSYRTFIKHLLLIDCDVIQQAAPSRVTFVDHSMQHGDSSSTQAQFSEVIFQQQTYVCDFECTIIHKLSFSDIQFLWDTIFDIKGISDIQKTHQTRIGGTWHLLTCTDISLAQPEQLDQHLTHHKVQHSFGRQPFWIKKN